MKNSDKKELSEIDICDLFITPALIEAGWDQETHVRREVTLTPGPVSSAATCPFATKKKKFADYVLQWEKGVPLAVIESKDNNRTISHGMQQALGCAEILEVSCAFNSKGDACASHNKVAAPYEDIETEIPLESFPAPEELWQSYKTLVENLLEALISAADHAGFSVAWERIAQHFDTLFATEQSIDQLKQTIFQIAVRGNLLPQSACDEPAS